MKREQATQKLVRILQRVDSGQVPAKVKQVYVFGSYARGALEPHDLDLLVVYEDPGKKFWEDARKPFEEQGLWIYAAAMKAWRQFHARLRDSLRARNEPVDLTVTSEFDVLLRGSDTIRREDLVLLWSETDRDWEPKVAQLVPNPEAGRAPREEIFPLKRLWDDLSVMRQVVRMIAEERLVLTKIPIETMEVKLNRQNREHLKHWLKVGILGKELRKVMPYALAWLQAHGQRFAGETGTEIWSSTPTHRVHMGIPSLTLMLVLFREKPKLRRQCLIPYFTKQGPNELLVFERGPRWAEPEEDS